MVPKVREFEATTMIINTNYHPDLEMVVVMESVVGLGLPYTQGTLGTW